MDGEEMDDKQIFIIFQTENQIVFQLINTARYEIKFPKFSQTLNPFVLWKSVRCPDPPGISICFPVPSIVVTVVLRNNFSQSRYKASVQSPSWRIIHSWIISKISCVTFSPTYTLLSPLEKYAKQDDSHILLLNLTLWYMTCEDLDMSPSYIPPFKYFSVQWHSLYNILSIKK